MNKSSDVVRSIFSKSGFEVQDTDVSEFNFKAKSIKEEYLIAIRKSKSLRMSTAVLERLARELKESAQNEEEMPVLVVLGKVDKEHRELLTQDDKIVIVDICNLLYMVREKGLLKTQLVAELEYSVDYLIPEKPDISTTEIILLGSAEDPVYEQSEQNKEQKWFDETIKLLSDWEPTQYSSTMYEVICCDVLKKLFADDLTLWYKQKTVNDGLFRFDLVCKIKNGNEKEFWRMAEGYFSSKYIVFEFKNYSGMIGQREIFTTVKYLYKKALRGIAVIISTNGLDEHANKAVQGILREEGKLILSLTNADLIEMLKIKKNNEDPGDYLSEKLDMMLIDLEK